MAAAPGAYKAMLQVSEYVKRTLGEELVDLTLAVNAINGWNRVNIAFQMAAGHYKAGSLKMKSA
ncbi:hypothetical protein F2P47_02210 [Parvibaculum sedimenti]|uniref:Carboxymuconolactone decarboxylase-like domain-containing protein n=1 Tax=Parvibaculum sedimenti TaxID=2608632 RepID=A0A6N6VLA1_9HYPH|nr:hypothetical protein [Parvibaculum sedimenti]KAB7742108.1 hypothetical protein F2P47_02210 [Parvibaculum sedimenti]